MISIEKVVKKALQFSQSAFHALSRMMTTTVTERPVKNQISINNHHFVMCFYHYYVNNGQNTNENQFLWNN